MEIMDYEKIIKQMIADEAISKEVAAKYFPELKESEGERIVKAFKYALDHVFTNNTTVYETTKEQCLAWLKKLGEQKPAEWSEEDERMWLSAIEYICTYPAHTNSVVDWLKSLKDRVQPQTRQERSEDDDVFYNRTIGLLEQYNNSDSEVEKQSALSCVNWLKSVIKHEKIIKYKIGDKVRFFSHDSVFTISDIDETNERYISKSGDSISFYEELILVKNSINKDDIKCGDYLTTEDRTIIKVHDVDEFERVHHFYYASVMTEDGGDISNNFMHYCAILSDCRRATQEEIDFLEKWGAHKKYVWVENNVSPDDEEDD